MKSSESPIKSGHFKSFKNNYTVNSCIKAGNQLHAVDRSILVLIEDVDFLIVQTNFIGSVKLKSSKFYCIIIMSQPEQLNYLHLLSVDNLL